MNCLHRQQQAADGLQLVQVLVGSIPRLDLLLAKVVVRDSQGHAVEYHLAPLVRESKGRRRVRAGIDEHPHDPWGRIAEQPHSIEQGSDFELVETVDVSLFIVFFLLFTSFYNPAAASSRETLRVRSG